MMAGALATSCPICDSEKTSELLTTFDDRYGYPGPFTVQHCRDCKHRFVVRKNLPTDIGALYSQYYPRAQYDVSAYQPLLYPKGWRSWLKGDFGAASMVPANVRVLDIGCGFCETLGLYRSRGCEAWGVEPDAAARAVADRYGFNLKTGVFRAADFPGEYFDWISMDQVIEHLLDPVQALQEARLVLKPSGRIAIGTPNGLGLGARWFGKHWIHWHVPYHLHYFSRRSIAVLAERSGYKVRSLETHTQSEWMFYQALHGVFFPEPGAKSGFWGGTGAPPTTAKQESRRTFVSRLHRRKLFHYATRALDALGAGDNFVAVLER